METVFDMPHTAALNEAELKHLASLNLSIGGKTVLEVGAGVGNLTRFFEERGCIVHSTDGRSENVAEIMRRHPHRTASVIDLRDPHSHDHLGKFDIVFCYGVLYHVAFPDRVIEDLARVCKELLLLSTAVNPVDDGWVYGRWDHLGMDQSLDHFACRPSRDWIMHQLGRFFPFVYITTTQPDHPQYRLEWPARILRRKEIVRSVFVASKRELESPFLSATLLMSQERHNVY